MVNDTLSLLSLLLLRLRLRFDTTQIKWILMMCERARKQAIARSIDLASSLLLVAAASLTPPRRTLRRRGSDTLTAYLRVCVCEPLNEPTH